MLLRRLEARVRLERAVDGLFAVAACSEAREVFEVVRSCDAGVLLIEAADDLGAANAPTIAAIRERCPELAILVYCHLTPGSSAAVLACAQAGASALLFEGIDDSRHAIQAAVRSARFGRAARSVHDAVAAFLPSDVRPLLRYAVSPAAEEPTVADAADSLGVDRKTLLNWLRRHTEIGPREFINWVRLAIAITVVESTARSVEHVAHDFGFASGAAFRNMLRCYTGTTAPAARIPGEGDRVIRLFEERFRSIAESAGASRELAGAPANSVDQRPVRTA